MNENRGAWYLLTGIFLGLVLGVVYAWALHPQPYGNTTPATLRSDFKDQYRLLIAAAYAANQDLVRAQARLALLKDPDPAQALADQARQTLAGGAAPELARSLALLSAALSRSEGAPAASRSTPTTGFPAGGSQVEALQPVPYVLQEQARACDPILPEPLFEVRARDAAGLPAAGVEVVVSWEGGEQHFFTGLHPDQDPGYADFSPSPGVTYTLSLAAGGQAATGLAALDCSGGSGMPQWGAWRLTFIQAAP